MDMQEFIDLFGGLATGVIAFATIVLVYVTWNLARVSERKPYVVGNLESTEYHPRYVNFVIRNTGNAPAFDVKATITPAIPDIDGTPLEGDEGSNYSILILPPNQIFSFMGFDIRKTSMEKFDITISWASKPKGKKRKTLTHSIDNRGNKGGWDDKGLDRIARELEKITKHFRNFNPKDPR